MASKNRMTATWFDTLVTVLGVAMSCGYYPQAYAIWKHKSAGSVSLLSYSVFVIGTITWTIYGFYKHDWAIIWSFIIGAVGSTLVLALALYYRKNKET